MIGKYFFYVPFHLSLWNCYNVATMAPVGLMKQHRKRESTKIDFVDEKCYIALAME